METKFQTSFIPKKSVPPTGMAGNVPIIKRPRSSIVMMVATIIFAGSLVGAGGSYAWNSFLIGEQERYKADLEKRESGFQLDEIRRLKELNVQINTIRQLMASHVAVSQLFEPIGRLTAEKVRFLNLDFSTNNTTGTGGTSEAKINMNGSGKDLLTVAFQAQVLRELDKYDLRNVVRNPVLADPTENEKSDVSFRFSATMNPEKLLYSRTILGDEPAAPLQTPPTP